MKKKEKCNQKRRKYDDSINLLNQKKIESINKNLYILSNNFIN